MGPTILDRVTCEMRVGREEIFGPVLSVVRVDSLDEAIELTTVRRSGTPAPSSEHGAAVRQLARERRGRDAQGKCRRHSAHGVLPFNGIKDSFYGDLHATGKDGVQVFTENEVEITLWFSEPWPSSAMQRPVESGG